MLNSKKVAFYCRSACEDDAAIGKQAAILRDYAKKHGYDNRALYVDNGFSGIEFDRPAFKRLEKHIADSRIEMVVVTDLSRISRKPFELFDWISKLWRNGIKFVSVKENLSNGTLEQKNILFQLFSVYIEINECLAVNGSI